MDILEILKDYNPVHYKDSEIKMQCPYRELHTADSQSRSQAFLSTEKNLFHCFSCGTKKTAIGVLTTKMGLELADAIDLVQFDFIDKELAPYEPEEGEDPSLPEYEPEFIIESRPPEIFLDRGFRASLLKEFRVGVCTIDKEEVIAIPYYDGDTLVGVKYRVEGDKRYFWYSPHFRKGEYLYNKAEGSKIILVEGETDVWRSIQYGFRYTSAILGTSITDWHVKQLAEYDTVYIGFDNDQAGFLAREKAYLQLSPFIEDIRFIPYQAEDPGSCTKNEWTKGIVGATDYAVYSYEMMLALKDYEEIQKTARRLVRKR